MIIIKKTSFSRAPGYFASKQDTTAKNSNSRLSKFAAKIFALIFLSAAGNGYASDGHTDAKHAVINQPCQPGETVDQLLNHKHRNLYTDLGWRVFALDEGGYLVERSFLVSKFAELRYRWRVNQANSPEPVSEQANKLCSS